MTLLHEYVPDVQRGAGNCECGAAKEHRRHPHRIVRSYLHDGCVCGLPFWDRVHE